MKTLYTIGEVLIDFIPQQEGMLLKDVASFEKMAGGAPANVAATVAKLGGNASLISQVGADAFGQFLIESLQQLKVNTNLIKITKEANTALAFVSLTNNRERDFSFYRNPSADLLYKEEYIKSEWFTPGDLLHFCSVDLVESPMKEAHKKAISFAREHGTLISFDPNVRLPLWESKANCRKTILKFLPSTDIVKISDEELAFITGIDEVETAIASLFIGHVKVVIYTKGASGATLFTKDASFSVPGCDVNVQDTTGAGDAFIGAILYKLLISNVELNELVNYCIQSADELLSFANHCGTLTTTKKGAFAALPTLEDIQKRTKT